MLPTLLDYWIIIVVCCCVCAGICYKYCWPFGAAACWKKEKEFDSATYDGSADIDSINFDSEARPNTTWLNKNFNERLQKETKTKLRGMLIDPKYKGRWNSTPTRGEDSALMSMSWEGYDQYREDINSVSCEYDAYMSKFSKNVSKDRNDLSSLRWVPPPPGPPPKQGRRGRGGRRLIESTVTSLLAIAGLQILLFAIGYQVFKRCRKRPRKTPQE